MKEIKKLNIKVLSKKEQKLIKGGSRECYESYECSSGYVCEFGKCVPGTP